MAETHFDEWIAEHYRTLWPHLFEPALVERTVDVLVELANGGAALEFGIGTGRIAVPLSQRGVRVQGIELSPAMITQLHAEPDGTTISGNKFEITDDTRPNLMRISRSCSRCSKFGVRSMSVSSLHERL